MFEGALSVKVSGDTGSNIGIMVSSGGKIEMEDSLKINVSGTNSKGGLWVQRAGSSAEIKGVAVYLLQQELQAMQLLQKMVQM